MHTVIGTQSELPTGLEKSLAMYRHEVFIKALQWQLPVENGLERDQFDRPDTVYVIVEENDNICGCARLLPTIKPYLLDEVFPELMNGAPTPHSTDTWELSRFSTMVLGEASTLSREEARRRFCLVLGAVTETAMARGATRLITFTALGVERILRSIGVHAHRVGPPRMIDDKPVIAIWIELDEQTRASLGLPVGFKTTDCS